MEEQMVKEETEEEETETEEQTMEWELVTRMLYCQLKDLFWLSQMDAQREKVSFCPRRKKLIRFRHS